MRPIIPRKNTPNWLRAEGLAAAPETLSLLGGGRRRAKAFSRARSTNNRGFAVGHTVWAVRNLDKLNARINRVFISPGDRVIVRSIIAGINSGVTSRANIEAMIPSKFKNKLFTFTEIVNNIPIMKRRPISPGAVERVFEALIRKRYLGTVKRLGKSK